MRRGGRRPGARSPPRGARRPSISRPPAAGRSGYHTSPPPRGVTSVGRGPLNTWEGGESLGRPGPPENFPLPLTTCRGSSNSRSREGIEAVRKLAGGLTILLQIYRGHFIGFRSTLLGRCPTLGPCPCLLCSIFLFLHVSPPCVPSVLLNTHFLWDFRLFIIVFQDIFFDQMNDESGGIYFC